MKSVVASILVSTALFASVAAAQVACPRTVGSDSVGFAAARFEQLVRQRVPRGATSSQMEPGRLLHRERCSQ